MFREKIKLQTQKLHLIPADNVLDGLEKDASKLNAQIDLLKTIDVTNVKPMVRIDETPISYLREDEPGLTHDLLSQQQVLANAPLIEGEFIAIRRAAKND